MTRLRLLPAAVLLLVVTAVPAAAQDADGTLCSSRAIVSWTVDLPTITVAGATVEVPGCDDGELVGLELITTDGDLPEDGPLGAEVTDERAVFDLTDLEVRVEPVTGVRVYLVIDEDEPPVAFLTVVVEQRLFNAGGNEQTGLRETTTFTIAPGATYVVPGAPTGYEDVACNEVTTTLPDGLLAEGAGSFTADRAGTHVACYQQVPGTPGGPGPGGPDVEEPEVLGEVLERNDDPAADETDDEQQTAGGSRDTARSDGAAEVLGRTIARTGVEVRTLLLLSLLLLAVGARLLIHRQRMQAD